MSLHRFGLQRRPFENVPDPAFFVQAGQYGRILSTLVDSVQAGRGLMVVSGPIGSGKTTLSQKLVSLLPDTTTVVWLAEPPASGQELFEFLAQELGLTPAGSRAFLLRDIGQRLKQLRQRQITCLLLIDESHHMSEEVLEGIRILTNLEGWSEKLVQIVLIGQPELMDLLQPERMEPLRQRVAVQKILDRMDVMATERYVYHRLRIAGAEQEVFSPAAVQLVAHIAGGIPRLVNNLCQAALRAADEAGKTRVEVDEVRSASLELGLGQRSSEYLRWQRENLAPSVRPEQSAASVPATPAPAVNPPPPDIPTNHTLLQPPANPLLASPLHSAGTTQAAPEPVSPPPPSLSGPLDIPFETRRSSRLRRRSHKGPLALLLVSTIIFLASAVFYAYRQGHLPRLLP